MGFPHIQCNALIIEIFLDTFMDGKCGCNTRFNVTVSDGRLYAQSSPAVWFWGFNKIATGKTVTKNSHFFNIDFFLLVWVYLAIVS